MSDTFDLAIIGAGEPGQAAAYVARDRGASLAIVDRELVGGSCPFWACMPSKARLHAAAIHAQGGDSPWPHVSDLEAAGVEVIRGEGRPDGPGRVVVRTADADRTGGRCHGAPDTTIRALGLDATIDRRSEGCRDRNTLPFAPRQLSRQSTGPDAEAESIVDDPGHAIRRSPRRSRSRLPSGAWEPARSDRGRRPPHFNHPVHGDNVYIQTS